MSKPRTEAQKLASRLNGQKSRGPKTAEGKAISARNAITHGLNSASVVLWCEKKEKYNQYLEDLTAEWEPETITELELVTALADAQWQLKRLNAIRTASIDLEMDRALESFRQDFPASDETTRLALAWQALAVDSRCLGELNRHEAHLRRIVNSSISKLLAIGEARSRQQQPAHENNENEPRHQHQQQRPALEIVAATIAPAEDDPRQQPNRMRRKPTQSAKTNPTTTPERSRTHTNCRTARTNLSGRAGPSSSPDSSGTQSSLEKAPGTQEIRHAGRTIGPHSSLPGLGRRLVPDHSCAPKQKPCARGRDTCARTATSRIPEHECSRTSAVSTNAGLAGSLTPNWMQTALHAQPHVQPHTNEVTAPQESPAHRRPAANEQHGSIVHQQLRNSFVLSEVRKALRHHPEATTAVRIHFDELADRLEAEGTEPQERDRRAC